MAKAADSTSTASGGVQAALLEYFGAPGKYPIGSRQPDILFHAIDDVLLVAAGRTPGSFGPVTDGLRDAAAFFVGAALLYPGADHYALLGMRTGSAPERLKDRYRLLMRLVHPDFDGSLRANWPKDSAMRVNRAYEVLSSPVLRREYDEQLASTGTPQRNAASHATRRSSPTTPRARHAPRLRIGKSAAWVVIVLLCLMAIAMLLPHRDPVGIVQKPKPAAGDPSRAALAVPSAPAAPAPSPQANDPAGIQPSLPAATPRPADPVLQVEATVTKEPLRPTAPVPLRVAAVAPAPAVASGPVGAPSATPRLPDVASSGGAETRSGLLHATASPQTTIGASIPVDAAAAPVRVAASRFRAAPTLTDAQPLLGLILQSMESGNAEQLLHLLETDSRQATAAQAFLRHYQRLVAKGGRVTLSHAEFKGEPRDDVLIVTGNFRLQLSESTIGSPAEKVVLRAMFESRGGRVALTGLSGVTE